MKDRSGFTRHRWGGRDVDLAIESLLDAFVELICGLFTPVRLWQSSTQSFIRLGLSIVTVESGSDVLEFQIVHFRGLPLEVMD